MVNSQRGPLGRAVPKLLQFSQKSCSNFPKKLLKSCSKILKVAQKLPQNPKVSQKLLSIFGCKRLIYNSNNDLINKFRFT